MRDPQRCDSCLQETRTYRVHFKPERRIVCSSCQRDPYHWLHILEPERITSVRPAGCCPTCGGSGVVVHGDQRPDPPPLPIPKVLQ